MSYEPVDKSKECKRVLDPKNGVLDRHKAQSPDCEGTIKFLGKGVTHEVIDRLNPKEFTLFCPECEWQEKWESLDPNNTNELPLSETEQRFMDKYGLNLRELRR